MMKRDNHLKELALLFLKLGTIGFGGPAVHIAMMEEEVVRKRKWFSAQHFLDLVGATNLIPGPNSTEMAMHCGQEKGGWKGLVVAGCCFIMPAVIITGIMAWAYKAYGHLPHVQQFIYGIKPAVIAVIVAAMISLGKKAVKSIALGLIGIVCMLAALMGVNEIIVLFGAGAIGIMLFLLNQKRLDALPVLLPVGLLQLRSMVADISEWKLFLTFLKIGSILYGSGYVLFAFLDAELVAKGLLSKQQLTDAIAIGQFTPGPVFSAATFIGWQIGGVAGAVAATIGIFLPAFLLVGLLNPLIPLLRRSGLMSAFLDTVNVASVAIILSVAYEMAVVSVSDWRTALIAFSSFLVIFVFKRINTALIIAGGSIFGYILLLV